MTRIELDLNTIIPPVGPQVLTGDRVLVIINTRRHVDLVASIVPAQDMANLHRAWMVESGKRKKARSGCFCANDFLDSEEMYPTIHGGILSPVLVVVGCRGGTK